jgi:hypothetical protein
LSFKLPLDEAEKFVDLVYSNTGTPIIKLEPALVTARNMDSARTTLYELKAPVGWFYQYRVGETLFIELSLADRKAVKALIRAAKAAGKTDVEFKVEGNRFLLEDTHTGVVDRERKEFEQPEFKIELPNRISGWTEFARDLKRWISSARRTHANYIGIACTEPTAMPPVRGRRAGIIKAFDENVQVELTPESIEFEDPEFGAAYSLSLVEQFMPPSVWLRRPYPYVTILGATGYGMPMGIDMTLGVLAFKAYVAPNLEGTSILLRKLNLLKPLTKEDVMIEVRDFWLATEADVSASELEDKLRRQGYTIGKLEELLRQLVKEGKLKERKAGWRTLYIPTEAEVKLKPLTEDVVLAKLRELIEAWNTDAIGYSELETVLARQYQILPLHDILTKLRKKGLADVKPWPARRPSGYAVDMRGYWYVEPTEPEEALKQAQEMVKLKELAKEMVLSTLKKLNMEVKGRVSFDDIASRLATEGYDTTKLGDLLTELRREEKVSLDLAGKWWFRDIEEKLRLIKEKELLFERYKKEGTRDPREPARFLPPEHPLSKLLAKRVEVEIKQLREEISQDEYAREVEEMDKEIEGVRKELMMPPPVVEKPPPTPVPPGYIKVRFLRDMVRFIGTDRKVYGPFRAHEEAVIPAQHAEIFEKHRYVEIIKQGSASTHNLSNPQTLFTDQEKQPITMEYKLLEYGVLE